MKYISEENEQNKKRKYFNLISKNVHQCLLNEVIFQQKWCLKNIHQNIHIHYLFTTGAIPHFTTVSNGHVS